MAEAEPAVEHEHHANPDERMDLDLVREERDLRQVITLMAKDQRDRARETQEGIASLFAALAQNGGRFRREATQRPRAVVSEVYSSPRVTDAARRHPLLGCMPGLALDITATDHEGTQCNIDIPEMRKKAERLLDSQKLTLFIGASCSRPSRTSSV